MVIFYISTIGIPSTNIMTTTKMSLLKTFRRRLYRARRAFEINPRSISWLIRYSSQPEVYLPALFPMPSGTKLYLKDKFDDSVVLDLVRRSELFFPKHIHLSENSLIVDIGAYKGYWTVEALARWRGSKVIAVEPEPTAVKSIKHHLQRNHLSNRCTVVEAAVGDDEETILTLQYVKRGSLGNTTSKIDVKEVTTSIEVHAITLSDIIGTCTPSLIKCNAEGAEFKVVPQLCAHGIRPTYLLLALHPEYGEVQPLLDLLRSAGYTMSSIGSARRPFYHCVLTAP